MKRKMTWVKKVDDDESLILPHHGASGNSILIAMPKNHQLSKEDVKAIFEEKMDSVADNAFILPTSRNCLLHFESTDTVQALLSKKVVMINSSQCRVGLFYGAQTHPNDTRNNENVPVRPESYQTGKRKTPEKPNSRAAALKAAGNKKRRVD